MLVMWQVGHATPPVGYKLVWADEFDGPALDTNKWGYRQLGVRGDAINAADAVSISNGCLTITSYTVDKKHFTGMVSTAGLFEPIHGYWEARIKFQDTPGEWSAFWLQTPTMANPLSDPGKAGTEIDICEHRSWIKAARTSPIKSAKHCTGTAMANTTNPKGGFHQR